TEKYTLFYIQAYHADRPSLSLYHHKLGACYSYSLFPSPVVKNINPKIKSTSNNITLPNTAMAATASGGKSVANKKKAASRSPSPEGETMLRYPKDHASVQIPQSQMPSNAESPGQAMP